ncbi:thrombospondin-related anonymous protein, partial [Hepatocystis sp. ex Piliocolobus tephrosceles]
MSLRSNAEDSDTVTYTEQICNQKMDVHLLLDGSGSIGKRNWKKYIYPMTLKLVNDLNISPQGVNFSLILFNNVAEFIIPYSSQMSMNKKDALFAIQSSLKNRAPRFRTNLTSALTLVLSNYLQNDFRDDTEQLVIIVTDGEPNDPKAAFEKINILNDLGAKIVIFGIGHDVNDTYNRQMAGCTKKDTICPSYYHADWFNAIDQITPFMQKVCVDVEKKISCGEWDSEWSKCSVPCGAKGVKTKKRISRHPNCINTLTQECYEGKCFTPILESEVPHRSDNNNKYQNNVHQPVKSANSYVSQSDGIRKNDKNIYPHQSYTSPKQNDATVTHSKQSNNENKDQKIVPAVQNSINPNNEQNKPKPVPAVQNSINPNNEQNKPKKNPAVQNSINPNNEQNKPKQVPAVQNSINPNNEQNKPKQVPAVQNSINPNNEQNKPKQVPAVQNSINPNNEQNKPKQVPAVQNSINPNNEQN